METATANTVANELNKHIVVQHTATLSRLYKEGEIGSNAANLYQFYSWVSSWQLTNQVRATDEFCMQGLTWGDKRFKNAKKLLVDLNIVETKVRRVEGKNQTFVVIHYLNSKSEVVLSGTSSFGGTNAIDKNNIYNKTIDKKNTVNSIGADAPKEYGNPSVKEIVKTFITLTGYPPLDRKPEQSAWTFLSTKSEGKGGPRDVEDFRRALKWMIEGKKLEVNKISTVHTWFPKYMHEVNGQDFRTNRKLTPEEEWMSEKARMK